MSDQKDQVIRDFLRVGQGQRNHAAVKPPTQLVVCGFGCVGEAVVRASQSVLASSDLIVIERDYARAEAARCQCLTTVYGDATTANSQRVAKVGSASNIIVCIDGPSNETIVRVARNLCPSAQIQAAVSDPLAAPRLRSAGADRVIVIPFVAGALLAQSISIR